MKVFQQFRLDTVNHCLWRTDQRVPLTPKAFDVLRYLVEHADRLVTQDEILEALWPETYVNPEVIKKYVLGIRKVLGDQPEKPAFVATFPKRGYQFIAAVRDESTASASDLSANAIKTIVGREDALTQLDDCLAKALNGQRQMIFVTGEAGIGKTTLVDVFNQRAAFRPNLRVARGQCVEGFGGKEAYYPVLEALGHLIRDAADGPVVQILIKRAPTWLIQFYSLVKAEQREALQRETLGTTRERMVREICEALEVITAENPLILILEDLHWVDVSTLDVISALARRRGPAKLVVLGTYRPADVVILQSPLKALKQDLLVHQLCDEILLERLEQADVSQYLDAKFAIGSVHAGLSDLIYQHSGGNPLFMVAIVQDLLKNGLITQEQGRWTLTRPLQTIAPGVPDTLQQMIESQFELLSIPEQRILKSASVAGERFSVWAISGTLELDPERVENLCEELVEKKQFIRSAGIHELGNAEFSAHYEFRHSLYREFLYRRLSEVNRSKLHRAIGERLSILSNPSKPDFASELAMHFEEGRDFPRAIQALLVSAGNAARKFAHRDAIQILQHALELVPKVPPDARTALELKILELIGDAHYALGAMEESVKAFQLEGAKAAQAGLKAAQVNALICQAHSASFVDPDAGIAVCEQAVRVSMTHDDPVLLARTQMLAASTRLLNDAWRNEDAEICLAANRIIRCQSDAGLSDFAQTLYAHVLCFQGSYREVLENAELGISNMGETSSLVVYLAALISKGLALLHLGYFGDVLRIARTGEGMAEKNGNDPWRSIFRCLEAWLRTLALDFEGARRLCEITMRTETERPARQPRTVAMLFTGYAELELGKHEEATRYFREIQDRPTQQKFFLQWYWRMQAQLGLCNVWLASGQFKNAHAESERFLESALSTADPNLQVFAWELKARVAITQKDWKVAEEYIQNALAILHNFEIPSVAWRVDATAWNLYRQLKNHDAAELHRKRAEAEILILANSFEPDEPLRKSFLAAAPVLRILGERTQNKRARGQGSTSVATRPSHGRT